LSLWNTVEFAHMPLGLVPEILDPIDVIMSIREEFRGVDPEVLEVRINNAVGDHFALNNRY